MKPLQITVAGTSGSGKTIVSRKIEQALKELDIEVTLVDDPEFRCDPRIDLNSISLEGRSAAITTVQLNREGTSND
jgi:adenylylsulfate kinase-like enzyme